MIERRRIIGTVAYMGGIMSLPEPFAWSWGNMLTFTQEALCQPGESILPERTKLSLHDYARNDLLSRMRGDWILMFDTDINFAPDIVARMVRLFTKYRLDVLTGVYCFKKPPHFPVLYQFDHESSKHEILAQWDSSCEVFQIDSAGAGALMVRRGVFERITAELQENPFDRIAGKGEDHSFFTRLRTLGIKAFCAPACEVEHLEYVGLKPSADYVPPPNFDHQQQRQAFSGHERSVV